MIPLPFRWDGESMVPRWPRRADEQFTIGEVYTLAPVEERSEASHRHEFAWLKEAWLTLPEHLSVQYPSAEHLRKRALIATGYCTTRDYPCSSRAEALRWAKNMEAELDEYAVVLVREAVVTTYRAESQSRRHMGKERFQASKEAILTWVAALLEVEPEVLRSQSDGDRGDARPVREAAA